MIAITQGTPNREPQTIEQLVISRFGSTLAKCIIPPRVLVNDWPMIAVPTPQEKTGSLPGEKNARDALIVWIKHNAVGSENRDDQSSAAATRIWIRKQ